MNYLAIFLAAVAGIILAGIRYGPVFGKQWMRMMGMTEADSKNMSKWTYVMELVNTMVMFAVFFILVDRLGGGTWVGAMEVAFTVWLGFIVTGNISSVLRSKKPQRGMFWINSLFSLVALAIGAWIYVVV